MVVHIASVLLTGFFVYLAVPGSDLFSWHPTCMSVAYILLLLQDKVQLHWILHAFGLVAAVGGFGSIYLNKEMNGRKHFTTWHGTVGLVAFGGTCAAVVGGILAKYSQSFSKFIRPVNMKLYHATAGMIVFIVAMTTIALATYSNWFKNRVTTAWIGRLVFWVPFVLAVCVARQVTQSYLPRLLEPKESQQDAKARKIQKKIEEKLARKAARVAGGNKDASASSQSDDDAAGDHSVANHDGVANHDKAE